MKTLITILLTLSSFVCSAIPTEVDSNKIHECRMELAAYNSAIKELQVKRDSIKYELRKAEGEYMTQSTSSPLIGISIIIVIAICGVAIIIIKR